MTLKPGKSPFGSREFNSQYRISNRLRSRWTSFASLAALACVLTSCGGDNKSSTVLSFRQLAHTFADTLVQNSSEETVLTLSNSGNTTVQVTTPTVAGSNNFSLVPDKSCGSQLAAGASCPIVVRFTPTSAAQASGNLSVVDPDSPSVEDRVSLVGAGKPLAAGTVAATANPVVASYTISPGVDAHVFVEVGTSTAYGLKTWSQPTTNGSVTILVAGMRQNTPYHMRATVQLPNGNSVQDIDQKFTTSAFPSSVALPTLTATTKNGNTPQPGVELVAASNAATTSYLQAYAADLQGNIIWGYTYSAPPNTIIQPIKLLNNGHMILIASIASQNATTVPTPSSALVTLREIDLAGTTIRELTLADLNAKLSAAGQNLTLTDFHHEVTPLPNGHFLLLTCAVKQYDNLAGYSGTTPVLGDVVVDLDQNFNPGWIWNEFDHLDVNRHPQSLPDWTHSNAILYSKDDGNILVSSRHQSWIIKVDYQDGAGSGKILWRLGEGGDFTLVNGTDPTDWFYGQHQPSFLSPNTTGVFTLTMMDNGFGRVFPAGVTCGSAGGPSCNYSRAPVFRIDEGAKTATLLYPNQQPSNYAFWGGGTTSLANGNLEFDLCGLPNFQSIVREVVQSTNPTQVWELDVSGANAYRANRIPSLYPGVQW